MKPRYLGIIILLVSVAIILSIFALNNSFSEKNILICTEICSLQKETTCSMEACLYNLEYNSNKGILVVVIGLFSAFLAGIGFYLSLTKEDELIKKKKYDITKLTKEEKNVFLFVKNDKEKNTYQSKIVEEFNFPKSKVTRILDKLEQQGLIERKRRGMSNLIVLK